jgi:hypothetical protein
MYKLVKNEITGQINSVSIIDGQNIISIPFVEDNMDYREYLAWLAEGNEPLPADE